MSANIFIPVFIFKIAHFVRIIHENIYVLTIFYT